MLGDYSVALIGPSCWQFGSVVKSKTAPQPLPDDTYVVPEA